MVVSLKDTVTQNCILDNFFYVHFSWCAHYSVHTFYYKASRFTLSNKVANPFFSKSCLLLKQRGVCVLYIKFVYCTIPLEILRGPQPFLSSTSSLLAPKIIKDPRLGES